MIFFVNKITNEFLSGFGLTEDFERKMCFESVAVGMSALETFCECNNGYYVEDFLMYVKAEVY